ncbi:alpha/beta fold hydrolase [Streptomyces aquilus]|uniref:Alpha/beta fold hydrolase n=1 Tax=Streptomyces aquilus TaxID=2548456 RepID=A0A3S9HRU0_9ACTN|nr:alpha/beta fold hydrolase [Streptomyces aquilus]AZP14856.1 alpha/beta fold hydrolase [Streptomyces aquilus]
MMEKTSRRTGASQGGRWIVARRHRPDAAADLFCFTHAGGSPGEYLRFEEELPEIQVSGIQLPGRASRLREPPLTSMASVVDAVLEVLSPERPFAFFGHSLGGLVAFEVARALRDAGQELPRHLFLSSSPPPPLDRGGQPVHTLSDDMLLAEIEQRWGELPAEIRADPRLLQMALGVFRADITIYETYRYQPGPLLDVPVTVFVGDLERDQLRVAEWSAHTSRAFELFGLVGDHFPFRDAEQRRLMLEQIRHVMAELEPGPSPRNAEGRCHDGVAIWGRTGSHHLLALAAESAEGLEEAVRRGRAGLTGPVGAAASDTAPSAGDIPLPYRRLVHGGDLGTLVDALAKPAIPASRNAQRPRVALVFPGQGSQYARMGLALCQELQSFAEEFQHGLDMLRSVAGPDVHAVLAGTDRQDVEALRQTIVAQPAIFLLEYALASTWQKLGVEPVAMIGHSLGEYVAATLAGVMTLPDALEFVSLRARLMQQAPIGAMLAVPLAEEELAPYLDLGADLATVNAPSSCVLAGTEQDIERIEARLAAAGTPGQRLRVSHAFHSRLMEGCVDQLRAAVARLTLRPPTREFVSCITGRWITAQEATDPDYWARHMRQTVRFSDAVSTVLASSPDVLLECGPGQSMTNLLKRRPDLPASVLAVSSLPHPGGRMSEPAGLLSTIGKLWEAGAPLDLAALTGPAPGQMSGHHVAPGHGAAYPLAARRPLGRAPDHPER